MSALKAIIEKFTDADKLVSPEEENKGQKTKDKGLFDLSFEELPKEIRDAFWNG